MHRIDGPGATLDNMFTEGDPVGGVPATIVTDDWLNSVQEEIMSVLAAASVAPDKAKQNQLLEALSSLIRTQNLTSFATGGTATALTLTPAPALQAYAPYLRFNVKFSVTSGLNPTLNVSGKGPKSLKQYDSAGAKVAATFVAGQISDIIDDGTDLIVLDPLRKSAGIKGAFQNLKLSTSGLSAIINASADQITLVDSSGSAINISAFTATASTAVTGIGGVSTGPSVANTWYNVFAAYNPSTSAQGLFLDTNATAPTLPAGYTYYARIGTLRTDGSANKYPLSFVQNGRKAQYKVASGSNVTNLPVMASGSATTPIAVSVSAFVPPTASTIRLAAGTTTSFVSFAPNGSYTATPGTSYLSTATLNGHPFAGGYNSAFPVSTASGEVVLEANTVYYCSSGASGVMECLGWEDNL